MLQFTKVRAWAQPIYNRGIADFEAGKYHDANPYTRWTDEWELWYNGWKFADRYYAVYPNPPPPFKQVEEAMK